MTNAKDLLSDIQNAEADGFPTDEPDDSIESEDRPIAELAEDLEKTLESKPEDYLGGKDE